MNRAEAVNPVRPAPAVQAPSPAPGAGRLVAVVVTHNRLEKLKETLARLLDSPADELAAIVVADNASSDGTGAWLAAQEGVAEAAPCYCCNKDVLEILK